MKARYFVVPKGVHLAAIGAKPNDTIVLRPWHPTRPLTIIRHCDAEKIAAVQACTSMLQFVEEV